MLTKSSFPVRNKVTKTVGNVVSTSSIPGQVRDEEPNTSRGDKEPSWFLVLHTDLHEIKGKESISHSGK